MKTCLRCKGEGAQSPLPGAKLEAMCWICQGKGQLPSIDAMAICARVLTLNGKLQKYRPQVPYKLAMSMIGKPSSWGKIPKTVEEAQQLWLGTVDGRRSYYVWKVAKGVARTTPDVLGTKKFDPYRDELVQLAEKIKGELNAT